MATNKIILNEDALSAPMIPLVVSIDILYFIIGKRATKPSTELHQLLKPIINVYQTLIEPQTVEQFQQHGSKYVKFQSKFSKT